MILSAVVHGRYRQCRTPEEVDGLVGDVMNTLDAGDPWGDLDTGETAALYFAAEPLTEQTFAEPPFTWTAAHELVVSVNPGHAVRGVAVGHRARVHHYRTATRSRRGG